MQICSCFVKQPYFSFLFYMHMYDFCNAQYKIIFKRWFLIYKYKTSLNRKRKTTKRVEQVYFKAVRGGFID